MTEIMYEGRKRERELAIQRLNELEAMNSKPLNENTTPDTVELASEANSNYYKRKSMNTNRSIQLMDITEQVTNDVIVDLFVECYYNSLNIDEFTKITEETSIKENAHLFISGVYKQKGFTGFLESCDSNHLRELALIIEAVAGDITGDEIDQTPTGEVPDANDIKNKTISTVKKDSVAKKALQNISIEVANKVKRTIDNERQIANQNKETEEKLLSEGIQHKRKEKIVNLYRAIFESTTSSYITENTNISSEVVFTEATLQYQLLEFVNTVGLVDFTTQMVRDLSDRYRGK